MIMSEFKCLQILCTNLGVYGVDIIFLFLFFFIQKLPNTQQTCTEKCAGIQTYSKRHIRFYIDKPH